jgi:cytidylate kinase
MAIITISRGSYSKGKEIAEKVAQQLSYVCLPREDILREASEKWKIPEVKLVRAIHDAPRILERMGYGKEKYMVYIEASILHRMKADNVVYHGLAGHFFVKGVSHVLKVRVLANMEDRVRLEMQRENITAKEALRILEKDDEERRTWSKYMYGVDTWDPAAYDLVVHINKINVEDAVDIICHTANRPHFQSTADSQKVMDDLALASEVKATLIGFKPDIEVIADQGLVLVETRASLSEEERVIEEIEKIVREVPGVKDVQIKAHLRLDIP